MKILLVGINDLFVHPYADKYIKYFKENKVEYNFVFWNRSLKQTNDDKLIPFNYKTNTYQSLIYKLKGFIKYRLFVKKLIKSGKYDHLVFLSTQAMFLFGDLIKNKYKNKYIFDYRDETYEKIGVYRKIVSKYINNSYKTVISSNGFKNRFKDISDDKFVLVHNNKNVDYIKKEINRDNCPIKLSFWGMVRQPDYFKKLFDIFSNDEKFEVDLFGEGYNEILNEHISNLKSDNIKLHGRYNQEDINDFASNTDILINCYSNNSIQKNALTVKMYEGINYNIPMLIQKDSYMSNYLNEYGYEHIAIDFDNAKDYQDIKNQIIDKFKLINLDDSKIKQVIDKDENNFNELLSKFIKANDMLLICPRFYNYYKDILIELNNKGKNPCYIADECKLSLFDRIIKKFLPFIISKKFDRYFKKEINRVDSKDKIELALVVFGATFIKKKHYELLRKTFPNIKITYYAWDSVLNFNSIESLILNADKAYSFDSDDSKKYNIGFIPLYYKNVYQTNKLDYDVSTVMSFFIEKANSVNNVIKALPNDINPFIYLRIRDKLYLNKISLLHKNKIKDIKKYFHLEALDRNKVYELISSSKVIIDCPLENQVGLTMRTFETLASKKKLITTNKAIKDYDFYNPNNIYVIDENTTNIPKEFFDTPYDESNYSLMEKYYISEFVDKLIK